MGEAMLMGRVTSTITRGHAVEEVRRLKQRAGPDLLVWGHGRLSESLLQAGLIDVIDLSIHPLFLSAMDSTEDVLRLAEGFRRELHVHCYAHCVG